ncbi:type I-E CRISPR-associated protein Cas7/Cse4/CasC [Aeromicrobium sp. CTD01-1L150]|uniref:type I-E CRISPR-associated protein Cas7/Cse4/CasC n=1 Tax=Aeromicrobium sp. CTD01-1L150 TaxID=3341830 RepID=UPI0035C17BC5
MSPYLDLHVLQSVPPSNVNRDENGSPKEATYGGVRRARVSSQAWKRAIRSDFGTRLDTSQLAARTKRHVDKIASRITELEPSLGDEQAETHAQQLLKALGVKVEKPKRKKDDASPEGSAESSYLIFLSNLQIANLAELAVRHAGAGTEPGKREVSDVAQADHSVDIALFGRMVADLTDLRVDAAAQVAHAISVHSVSTEFDYFTAVDDHATGEHAGAGMIGTVEFNSSMLYRYATMNVPALLANLGDPAATVEACSAFLHAFIRSMPTGKQNTFAHRTLPHAVVATLRPDQPVNLVGAFEDPVERTTSESRLRRASSALATHAQQIDVAYGRPPGLQSWIVTAHDDAASLHTIGTDVNDVASLAEAVTTALRDTLEPS